MADNTKIEWTDATWNPITGCSVVSPGCTNCYAMRLAGTRLKHHWSRKGLTEDTKAGPVWNGKARFNAPWIDQPLRWTKPRMIFVCAHGDLFHEDVPDLWIDHVFAVMALADQHTFQVLTKRPERAREYITDQSQGRSDGRGEAVVKYAQEHHPDPDALTLEGFRWPLPNVWLGVSVEDQTRADERIPILLETPAAVRWISAEPLLGPIDLSWCLKAFGRQEMGLADDPLAASLLAQGIREGNAWARPALHWVVAGGESGPNARPMHPDWARSLRDQCAAAGVPFHFKQWGEFLLGDPTVAKDPDEGNPYGLPLLFPDGAEFDVCSDGEDIVLCAALDHRGAPKKIWQEWWASGDGHLARRVGKKAAGRLLDGVEHNGYPNE